MRAIRLLAVLWIAAWPLWGQEECPPSDVIADLPTPAICDTTCDKPDSMPEYSGTVSCTIQGVEYPGGDVVHEIFLNNVGEERRNTVGFRIESPDGDLALVLVRGDGTCIANSPDFIGAGVAEAIPAASYGPSGIFSLYVDSARGAPCGSYCLQVTGENPPRRDLEISAATAPEGVEEVVAGIGKGRRNLAHTITVVNPGPFRVRGLELRVELTRPEGTSLDQSIPPLDGDIWRVGTLCPGQDKTLTLFFIVGPSTADGAMVGSTTEIVAVEPDEPNFGDQELSPPLTTTVRREVNLVLETRAPESVIAGSEPDDHCPGNLCHTVTVTNDGPSDASDVALDVTLECAENVRLIEPSEIADCDRATVRFEVGDLAAGDDATRRLAFDVLPSAPEGGVVRSTAAVSLNETNDGDTETIGATSIRRRIDLRISQRATPSDAVVAGTCDGSESVPSPLVWRGVVRNLGPSDASALRLELALTSGLAGVGAPATTDTDFADGVWTIPVLPAGGSETLTTRLTVGPDARDGAAITHTLTLLDVAEEDRRGDAASSRTVAVERRVALALALDPEPAADVVAGRDDDAPNVLYRAALRNDGPSEAAGVEVVQSLTFPAAGVTLHAPRPAPGGTVERTDVGSGAELVWKPPDLSPSCGSGPPAASLELDLTVGPSAPHLGEITYGSFAVRANGSECAAAAGRCVAAVPPEPVTTTIRREVGFALEHGFSSARVVAGSGEELTYGVAITSSGPSDASGVEVVLPPLELPQGVTVEDPPAVDGDTWRIGGLERGATATLTRELSVAPSTAAGSEIVELGIPAVGTAEDADPAVELSPGISRVVVEAETDLEIVDFGALPDPAFAGGNVVYALTVRNDGPSDSTGAAVCTSLLPADFDFVASPDVCRGGGECGDGGAAGVRCVLRALAAGAAADLRFVVALDPALEPQPLLSTARALANETDGDGAEAMLEIDVVTAADLALALSDEKDPVQRGVDDVRYDLDVTNLGPGAAGEVTVRLRLPREMPCPSFCASCGGEPECDENDFEIIDCDEPECDPDACEIRFTIAEIAAGGGVSCDVFVRPPILGSVDVVEATASARGAQLDPVPGNNADGEVTTIAVPGDADLAVAQSAAPDPAIAGRTLTYTITVTLRGLAEEATGILVSDELPEGVGAPEPLPEGCSLKEDDPRIVECRIAVLARGVENRAVLPIPVAVDPEAADVAASALINRVAVGFEDGGPQRDPNGDNNATELTTAIVSPLVVPYFEAGGAAATAFAVRNAAEETITVRYQAVGLAEAPLAEDPPSVDLPGHATLPVVLGEGDPAAGYVAIGPDAPQPESPVDALNGDYFRLDPGSASGALLVDADPGRVPRGLCRRPRLGFVNGELGETDFTFFVPGNPGDEPVAAGRVYSPEGRFVQELAIRSQGAAFELGSREDLDLLARTGTVEWTFREGVVGHVVGIWRRGDAAVALPAFCPEPDLPVDDRPAPHLVLPFFEIGRGVTTVLGVHNASPEDVRVRYEYFDASGEPIRDETLRLNGRGTRLVQLTRVPGAAAPTGFVHVTAVDPEDEPLAGALLHGEWLRLAADGELASGDVLVDTRASLRPPGFCQSWHARFFNDGARGKSTELIFYAAGDGGDSEPILSGRIYDQGGAPKGAIDPPLTTSERAFAMDAADLVPEGVKAGAIEWEFQGDRRGYVATIHHAGGLSVAVPAACRDGAGEDP